MFNNYEELLKEREIAENKYIEIMKFKKTEEYKNLDALMKYAVDLEFNNIFYRWRFLSRYIDDFKKHEDSQGLGEAIYY